MFKDDLRSFKRLRNVEGVRSDVSCKRFGTIYDYVPYICAAFFEVPVGFTIVCRLRLRSNVWPLERVSLKDKHQAMHSNSILNLEYLECSTNGSIITFACLIMCMFSLVELLGRQVHILWRLLWRSAGAAWNSDNILRPWVDSARSKVRHYLYEHVPA